MTDAIEQIQHDIAEIKDALRRIEAALERASDTSPPEHPDIRPTGKFMRTFDPV